MKNLYNLRIVALFYAIMFTVSVNAGSDLKISELKIEETENNRVDISFSVINGEAPYKIILKENEIEKKSDNIVIKNIIKQENFWFVIIDNEKRYKHVKLKDFNSEPK